VQGHFAAARVDLFLAFSVGSFVNLSLALAALRAARGVSDPKFTDGEQTDLEATVALQVVASTGWELLPSCRVRVFDSGSVSVRFSYQWKGEAKLSALPCGSPDEHAAQKAYQLVSEVILPTIEPSISNLSVSKRKEDYLVSNIVALTDDLSEFGKTNGPALTKLITGVAYEPAPLQVKRVMDNAVALSNNDLILLDWDGAVLLSTASSLTNDKLLLAADVTEYANAQLVKKDVLADELESFVAEARELRHTGRLNKEARRRRATLLVNLTTMTRDSEGGLELFNDPFAALIYNRISSVFDFPARRSKLDALFQNAREILELDELKSSVIRERILFWIGIATLILEVVIVFYFWVEISWGMREGKPGPIQMFLELVSK